MKIIADKNIPYLKGVAESFGEVVYLDGSDFTHDAIKDADTLIVRTVTHFGEELLAGTNVKLICSATIGYDHIDTDYCDTHNIVWKNAPGCNSGSVEQYIVSSLVSIAQLKNFALSDKTIGIVGVGNVGRKVAKVCQLLGMKVLLNDPPRAKVEGSDCFVDLDTICKEADIITFHTPLVREGEYMTYHLGNEQFFASLERKPIIINSARGAIIQTHALKKAIVADQVSGVILDCWENEPGIDLELLGMVDIATPHIAGYSADGKANATRMSLEAIADFYGMDKSPITRVCPPDIDSPIIDLTQTEPQNRLAKAVLHTYNPMDDFKRLKENPGMFKQLRNNYPLRREYPAYLVKGANEQDTVLFKKMGFR